MNFNRDDSSTPIRFTPGREDKYSAANNDVGTRPAGDPKSSKNFQKILGRDSDKKEKGKEEELGIVDDESGTQSAMVLVEEQALKKKQMPTSLFELSSHASKGATKAHGQPSPMSLSSEKQLLADARNGALASNDAVDEETSDSPAQLYSKITSKEPKKVEIAVDHRVDETGYASKLSKAEEKKDKFDSRFASEQPDLSYVNPMALNAQPVESVYMGSQKPVMQTINIQEIIDQLVNKVVQMETGGQTDTVVTLKHPPMLAGADLIVTGFDSAKGEFNITFQKLTQAAKDMLDMHANQQSLLLALEQKGYAVHIVTTTTLAEINLPAAGAATPEDRRGQDQGQGHEHGKGQGEGQEQGLGKGRG